jgi:CO/xanthine dehydrogenase Mo-binding subunit/aerobic-type carbon monoxide dehydrogenase small subunit (CoxS/CutS family)
MSKSSLINFSLNGELTTVEALPGETLADLLRERLGLTGTKIGCNEAECGTCTVIVDGNAILSCVYPAERISGCDVITIEGLASYYTKYLSLSDDKDNLHPLQEEFIKQGAVQCGFCIPGQLMAAFSLIQHNPRPSPEDIQHTLKDTLCRCGGYPSIEKAILNAAKIINNDNLTIHESSNQQETTFNVIGKKHPRPDAVEKVTGQAIFTDDLKFKDMLFGRVKRAGISHGFLRNMDISAAVALPGVIAVLTADDIPGDQNHGVVIPDWPTMIKVGERIRYVGDAVAIVAAVSKDVASQALDLIKTDIEIIDPVVDPIQALDEFTPKLHLGGNLLKHFEVKKGDIAQGFKQADLILENTYKTQSMDHAFLEPECTVAVPIDGNRMEIYVGSQIPYADRDQIAAALGWEEKQVRVIGQLMGGGFGGKEDIAGQIHAALLANTTKKPVKILFDRHESLLVHPKRHATQIKVKVGATKNGVITAIQTELFGDTGAYASLGEKVMARATTHSTGPYDVPNIKIDCYATYTNNPPAGAFRGFGALQSQFAVENMIDRVAERLQIDPIEIRKINSLRIGSTTNTGQILRESVGLIECIEKVERELCKFAEQEGYSSLFEPKKDTHYPHLIRSWGFAIAYKNTGLGGGAPDKAGAEVELLSNGEFQVRTSSAELGQGLVTVLQMIAAEIFSIEPRKVQILVMDTDLTPDGGPTTASRQTYVTGNAVFYAAQSLKQAILSTIAEKFDYPPDEIEFTNGIVMVGVNHIQLNQVVKMMKEEGHQPVAAYEYWAPETQPLGEGGDMHFAYSFAAQAVEVEVNSKTGEVNVKRVISANDVGKAINPLGLQGQVEGGIVMGIGHALTENFILEGGYPFTDRFARYRIPNFTQIPEITSIIVEHPTSHGPFGAKGVGEIVSIPTIPAITNAIYNAVGVRIDSLPVDQEKIFMSMRS